MAKSSIKNKNKNEARDWADKLIAYVATKRHNGLGIDDEVEGIRIGLWLERGWCFLEKHNLLLDENQYKL